MPLLEYGLQAANNVINTGMGLLLEGHNDNRQAEQQKRLQEIQIQGNKEMADYNMKNSLKMWEETSYKAQMEQMKKAGLNPALLYGQGGAGGATTAGAATGAGVSGGNAPQGGNEIMGLMMMQAQIKNLEADTQKKEVEAEKTAGVDTELTKSSIENIAQGITESKAKTEVLQVDRDIKNVQWRIADATEQEVIRSIGLKMQQAAQTFDKMVRENSIGDETRITLINQAKQDLVQTSLQNLLIKANTGKTEAEIKEISAKIAKMAADIQIAQSNLGIQEKNAETGRMQWETNQQNANTNSANLRIQQLIHDISDGNKEIMRIGSNLLNAVNKHPTNITNITPRR
ncbi:MAG: DNA pilot protein [Microviridae sp.]|nr:MAG: DNA pilot protein [Microviridae sp.]